MKTIQELVDEAIKAEEDSRKAKRFGHWTKPIQLPKWMSHLERGA